MPPGILESGSDIKCDLGYSWDTGLVHVGRSLIHTWLRPGDTKPHPHPVTVSNGLDRKPLKRLRKFMAAGQVTWLKPGVNENFKVNLPTLGSLPWVPYSSAFIHVIRVNLRLIFSRPEKAEPAA